MNAAQYDQTSLAALAEIARRLPDLERRILQALKDKGPGLVLEIAVRVLKFPEDILGPLRELQTANLITTQTVAGQYGGELFSLTMAGEYVVRLLNDVTFQQVLPQAAAAPAAAPDPRRQEAELLNKLGDVAKEKGDLEKALEYYQQALTIARELTAEGGAK
ncbi:MAG: tetratricopeptide repeat protein [Acidobacteria bacterium]|nr:tetratricopeptide repeat protein [Acidobacteriota bacterium]